MTTERENEEWSEDDEQSRGCGRAFYWWSDENNWEDCLDDLDSEYWENHLGGPDDTDFESHENTHHQFLEEMPLRDTAFKSYSEQHASGGIKERESPQRNESCINSGIPGGHASDAKRLADKGFSMKDDGGEMATDRLALIIQWLMKCGLVTPLWGESGFVINPGTKVRLANGRVRGVVDWLLAEGVDGGQEIAGYEVTYVRDSGGERLFFLRKVVDAPFDDEDDELGEIPF